MLLQFKISILIIIKKISFNIFKKGIYSMRCNAEFSESLLKSSVSHDPSEILLIWWLAAQETFAIIINAYIFAEIVKNIFRIVWWRL